MLAVFSAHAQTGDTGFMQQQSGLLQHDADSARAQAEKLRSQAAQYREMAESAERNAATSSNPRDKDDWQKTARQHRENAEKLERDAAAHDEKARQAGAGVADLESRIEDTKAKEAARQAEFDAQTAEIEARNAARKAAEENNPNKGQKVENYIGLWRDAEHKDEPFVLVQKDPGSKAYPHRLEAHTPRRVWSGNFHTDPPPGEPLITLTYKPNAEEMNPEIPEWARKKIEGTLEWTLELNADGTCGTPELAADFYPGEVKWEEKEDGGKGKVSVEGKGEARRIRLHQSVGDMRFYSYGATKLYLRPAGLRQQQRTDEQAAEEGDFDENIQTVDALTHNQRFFVDVLMPYEEAEKAGENITVTVKASGGDKTSIELTRGALRRGRSVIYTHYDEITIADPLDVTEEDRNPPLLSVNYILGYQGARLDLDPENGELVTFSYGDALQTVPVFVTWVQRGINRHEEAILRLRPFLSMVLADPASTPAQKEEATKRLSMIRNYERIMESDKIHDFIRYHVGEFYFNENRGLIGMDADAIAQQAEITGAYYDLGDMRDGSKHPSGIYNGVVWTSQYEMSQVEKTVIRARLDYRDTALKEIPKALTFAMYEMTVGMSGAGDIYTVATGKDIYGKRVPGWQRVMTALNIVNAQALSFAAPHIMTPPTLQAFSPAQLSGRATRAGARMRLKTHEHIAAKYNAQKLETTMKTMNADQVESVMPSGAPGEKITDTTPSETPVGCGGGEKASPRMAQASSGPPPHPAPIDPDTLNVKRMMGSNTEIVTQGDPLLPAQKFDTCQCASVQLAMKEDIGKFYSEIEQFSMLVKNGDVKPGGNGPLSNGYTDAQLEAFLKLTGAEVRPWTAPKGQRALSLEEMDVWIQRGWRVRDVIKTVDQGIPHAIEVRKLIRNDKGQITEVQWYDPAFGKELKAPVCDYSNSLAAADYDVILYRWKPETPAQMAARQPTIEYPSARPKPTIQYPETQRSPGAAQKRADINVDDVQLLDAKGNVVTPQMQAAHRAAVKRLDRKLDELHPGETKPHLNTISRESLDKIYASQKWLPPREGGAAFSRAGSDVTARHEVVAVRVKPGHESYVEMVAAPEGTGYVPRYWKSGKKGVGESSDVVPAEHLEWIDGDQKNWVSFDGRPLEVDEFTMDD